MRFKAMQGSQGALLAVVLVFVVLGGAVAYVGVKQDKGDKQTSSTTLYKTTDATTQITTTGSPQPSVNAESKTTFTDVTGTSTTTTSKQDLFLGVFPVGPSLDTVSVGGSTIHDSVKGVSGSIDEEFSFTIGGVERVVLNTYTLTWEVDKKVIATSQYGLSFAALGGKEVPVGVKYTLPPLRLLGKDLYDAVKGPEASAKILLFKADLSFELVNGPFTIYRSTTFKAASLDVVFKPVSSTVDGGTLDSKTLPEYDFSLWTWVSTPVGQPTSVLVAGQILKGFDTGPDGSGAPLLEPIEALDFRVEYQPYLSKTEVGGFTLFNYKTVNKGVVEAQPILTTFTQTKTYTLSIVNLPDTQLRGTAVIGSVDSFTGGGGIGFIRITVQGGEAKDVFTGRFVTIKPFQSGTLVVLARSLDVRPLDVGLKWVGDETASSIVYGWKPNI